ncbi:MAG: hypothetical protein ACI4PL_07390 [Faecousia sp.]
MAEAKKTNAYSKLMHLVIGIAVAFLISRIPGPGGITPLGMALIGTFLVANYWFITIDMITGALASMVLYVLLAGVEPGPVVTGILGNTTVWQILVMLPLIYGLRVSGATDALANWMMTRKILYGKSTLFVTCFLLFSSLLCAIKVNPLVVLALAEGVMSAAGYEEKTKEHDAFLVATFFAGALASNIIPYGSWIAGFVTSFEKIAGIPLDNAVYMLFGIVLNIVLDFLYVLASDSECGRDAVLLRNHRQRGRGHQGRPVRRLRRRVPGDARRGIAAGCLPAHRHHHRLLLQYGYRCHLHVRHHSAGVQLRTVPPGSGRLHHVGLHARLYHPGRHRNLPVPARPYHHHQEEYVFLHAGLPGAVPGGHPDVQQLFLFARWAISWAAMEMAISAGVSA